MCGIAGFIGDAGPELLEAMATALAHRGPDDRGFYRDETARVGLTQTRLSIIDLSPAGHQPMVDASGRYVIVFNGEIYNYRELRAELLAEGTVLRGHSDTEALLEWYARVGPAVLERINGIFALAIWDTQQRELFVARDGLGVKPLYWSQQRGGFAFASELKALLPALESKTLDAAELHRYLCFLWCPGNGTPLREVRKLGPGEAAIVRDGVMQRCWTWYELPARRSSPSTAAPLSAAQAIQSVEQQLRSSVQSQLVADVPVGAFLSGGLDSSAIVAFAREAVPELRCFTIDLVGGQDAGFVDDLPYAKRVASHLRVPLDVVTVPAARMAEDFERMIGMIDEPLADPAPLNVLYISQLAREQGIKVLLSGAGGDDLFTGYRRHLALRYERLWAFLPATLRRALASAAGQLDASTALGRRAQRLFANAAGSDSERQVGYFAWAPEDRMRALYTRPWRAQLDETRAAQPMLDFLAGISPSTTPLGSMLALEQRFFLTDHNLTYTDRMSMAAGVEVRVPFLDPQLVDLAAQLPDDFKQHGMTSKWVLKKAMEPHLPHDIIYRPKTGFGAPLRRWLRNEMRPLVDDTLSASALSKRGIFDSNAVTALRKADEDGRIDGAYTLLSLISIELWCRHYLD